jgi:trehalose/maltose hydrolase-like predicted phosphorylase
VVNGNAVESRLLANRHLTQPTVECLGDTLLVEVQTTHSKIRIATAVRTTVSGADGQPTMESVDGQPMMRLDLAVTDSRPVVVGKLVAVSRDAAVASPGDGALAGLDRADDGFDEIVRRHVLAWQRLWEHFAVDVDTDDPVQLAVNLHVFTCCRPAHRTLPCWTPGCRPADCTGRATGGMCSGTSCSSYRST